MSSRESSLIAFDTLKTERLGRQASQVMHAVAYLIQEGQHTDGLVSRRQIAQVTGLETSTVAARTNALVAAKRLIEDERLHECPVTGRQVHMVGFPPAPQRAAA